jgi:hypothetical protein
LNPIQFLHGQQPPASAVSAEAWIQNSNNTVLLRHEPVHFARLHTNVLSARAAEAEVAPPANQGKLRF